MNLLLGRFLATGNYDVMWGIQNSTEESKDMRKLFLESANSIVDTLDGEDVGQFESDLSAISRKFQKGRLMIGNEDSDELVTSLGNFGTEKHIEDQKAVVVSISDDLCELLKIVDGAADAEGPVVKVMRCCNKIREEFENGDYRECLVLAVKCKNILEKTVLSGNRRWQSPIRENIKIYEKVDLLINNFIREIKKLDELNKLL